MYGLILTLIISNGGKTGQQAMDELSKYAQSTYQQMSKAGDKFDSNAFQAKISAKAKTLVSGLDAKTMPLTDAVDWAQIFDEAGSDGDAVTLLTRSLKEDPKSANVPQVKSALGNIYVSMKNLKAASELALSNDPVPEQVGYLDQSIAQAYQQQNDTKSALDFINKALASLNGSPTAAAAVRTLNATKTQMTMIGQPASEMDWLPQYYGSKDPISSLKGHVVVLDFFAHWCGPCKSSMPEMHKITDTYGSKGLKVIGVTAFYGSFEGKKVTQDVEYKDMAGFMKQYGIDHPVDYVKNEEMAKYGVTGIPEFVLIGKDGLVKKLQIGYGPGALDSFEKAIAEELAKPVPTAATPATSGS